jgi:hypothetical protein
MRRDHPYFQNFQNAEEITTIFKIFKMRTQSITTSNRAREASSFVFLPTPAAQIATTAEVVFRVVFPVQTRMQCGRCACSSNVSDALSLRGAGCVRCAGGGHAAAELCGSGLRYSPRHRCHRPDGQCWPETTIIKRQCPSIFTISRYRVLLAI